MPVRIDLVGCRFSRLYVAGIHDRGVSGARWKCICDCGRMKIVYGTALRNGRTKSCGCINGVDGLWKHGRISSPEYRSWDGMIQRCTNPNAKGYMEYGGRGIRVCDEWRDFRKFFSDMGERPSPFHSLDRINVNGNYEHGNCRWATIAMQRNNTRRNLVVCIAGRSDTLANWVRLLGVCEYSLAYGRIRKGMDPRKALQM